MNRRERSYESQALTVRLPGELHEAVRTLAFATESSINEVVVRAIRDYLSGEGHRQAVDRFLRRAQTNYRVALDKLADL